MEIHRSQGNEIAGVQRTPTGALAFLLQEESMDAIANVLESDGATPEPSGETAHPALRHIPYPHAITRRINGSNHSVAQEKI
jgi:hypothetical protein